MEEKKIVINIDDSGVIDAETFGIEGVECLEALDKLLKDLALETETTMKEEFFKNSKKIDNTIKAKND